MDRLDAWLSRTSPVALSILFLVITVAKNGFAFEVAAQEANSTFPLPQPGFAALSYGLPALVWLFSLQGSAVAIGLMVLAITVASYFLTVFLVTRRFTGSTRLLVLILVGMGPTFAVLFGNIGRHDVLIVTGSIIFGLSAARSGGGVSRRSADVLGQSRTVVGCTRISPPA